MTKKTLVYHKSAKGSEAIATRQHGLSPKLRSMLILIDGKRGFDELAKLSQGDTEQLLKQLLDQGFIEQVGTAAGPVGAAPAPASTATPAMTLQQAQRYASRRLTDVLGPNAEDLCLRIEGARNVHDFQVTVARAEAMVKQFRGATVAAEFTGEIQAHMPSA